MSIKPIFYIFLIVVGIFLLIHLGFGVREKIEDSSFKILNSQVEALR